jgi:hypothetical protein
MNVGLLYTPVSIYQMTRGALVLFVGILSVLFLHRRLWLYQLSYPSILSFTMNPSQFFFQMAIAHHSHGGRWPRRPLWILD